MNIDKDSLLEAFSWPANFGLQPGWQSFPDLSPISEALNFARYVRRILGDEARIVGYWHEDNPTAGHNILAGGHDFVIFENRFLIDASLCTDENLRPFVVLDLQDPVDAITAIHRYGDFSTWEFSERVEQILDAEGDYERNASLVGCDFGLSSEMEMGMELAR